MTITSRPRAFAAATSSTAVIPQSTVSEQAAALVGEPRDRDVRDAVALLEAARQMPLDVGAERAQRQDGERRGADAVDVIVAVDADPLAVGDRRADPVDRDGHVPEQERVVRLDLAGDERPRLLEVAVAAPDEDRRRDLPEVERIGERAGRRRSRSGSIVQEPSCMGNRRYGHGRTAVAASACAAMSGVRPRRVRNGRCPLSRKPLLR